MKDQLERLRRSREYFLGKTDAYAIAAWLVDGAHEDTIHDLIRTAREEAGFYDREIAKIEESLNSK
jgi:hypothetical protein